MFLSAGKGHLHRAIGFHEESLRETNLCKKLRDIQVLGDVLSAAHQRTRFKYAQHQEDDDLLNLIDAPDVLREWWELSSTWEFGCHTACIIWLSARVHARPGHQVPGFVRTGTGKDLVLLLCWM